MGKTEGGKSKKSQDKDSERHGARNGIENIVPHEMFARCTDQMARLGTRWRKGKMQKRLQRSHTHLISSAFSTQLELGILDPIPCLLCKMAEISGRPRRRSRQRG